MLGMLGMILSSFPKNEKSQTVANIPEKCNAHVTPILFNNIPR